MAKKKIGILTSGGDSPGMNAAIRAIVNEALPLQIEILGFIEGYQGLIEGKYQTLDSKAVQPVIRWGGSIIKSSRCAEFLQREGRDKAFQTYQNLDLSGLIVIGGNGTVTGAMEFSQENEINIIGLPGTIDNDISGTDYTIGFDTAVNTAMEAIDKIQDTANTMENLFFVEVMGRHSGEIALMSAIAGGADAALIPEVPTNLDNLIQRLSQELSAGKEGLVVVVAEGDDLGKAIEIAKKTRNKLNITTKVTVLGHTQRGGSPTARDRYLSTLLGAKAVQIIVQGKTQIMIGIKEGKLVEVPFSQASQKESHVQKMFTQGIIRILT